MGSDFPVFGKAVFLEFGKNEFAIDRDLKAAPAGRDQGDGLNVLLEGVDDFIRHPDGLFFVASSSAIFNFYPGHTYLFLFC